jgi:hypothetical protein
MKFADSHNKKVNLAKAKVVVFTKGEHLAKNEF